MSNLKPEATGYTPPAASAPPRPCEYPHPHAAHDTPAGRCQGITNSPAAPITVNVEAPRQAAYVQPPARVLHALLTLATSGVWGFVWVWRERKYRRAVRDAHR